MTLEWWQLEVTEVKDLYNVTSHVTGVTSAASDEDSDSEVRVSSREPDSETAGSDSGTSSPSKSPGPLKIRSRPLSAGGSVPEVMHHDAPVTATGLEEDKDDVDFKYLRVRDSKNGDRRDKTTTSQRAGPEHEADPGTGTQAGTARHGAAPTSVAGTPRRSKLEADSAASPASLKQGASVLLFSGLGAVGRACHCIVHCSESDSEVESDSTADRASGLTPLANSSY